jgi:hypothetical protein
MQGPEKFIPASSYCTAEPRTNRLPLDLPQSQNVACLRIVLEKKKGADQGIDGRLYFHDEKGGKTKQIILSVKAGKLHAPYVRDLRGVIEREKAEIGVLISMEAPTKPMQKEAAEAGFYKPPGLAERYPRIQILSIEELLEGKKIDYPRYAVDATFKKAPKARKAAEEQIPLGGDIEEPF